MNLKLDLENEPAGALLCDFVFLFKLPEMSSLLSMKGFHPEANWELMFPVCLGCLCGGLHEKVDFWGETWKF